MSTLALTVMVVVCGIVWGGFAAMLVWMTVSERQISESRGEDEGGG